MASDSPRRSPRKSPQKSAFEEVPLLKGEASSAENTRGKPLALLGGPHSPLNRRTSESDDSNESDDAWESGRNAKLPEVKYYPHLYENDYPLPTIEYNDLPPFDSTPITPLNLPVTLYEHPHDCPDYDDDYEYRLADPVPNSGIYLGELKQPERKPKDRNVVYGAFNRTSAKNEGLYVYKFVIKALQFNRSGKPCPLNGALKVVWGDICFRPEITQECMTLKATETFCSRRVQFNDDLVSQARHKESLPDPEPSNFIDPFDKEIADYDPLLWGSTPSPPPGILNMFVNLTTEDLDIYDKDWEYRVADPVPGAGIYMGVMKQRERRPKDRNVVYGSLDHLDQMMYSARSFNRCGKRCEPPKDPFDFDWRDVDIREEFGYSFDVGDAEQDDRMRERLMNKRRLDWLRGKRWEKEVLARYKRVPLRDTKYDEKKHRKLGRGQLYRVPLW